jgi:hypothetical protein
MRRRGDTTTIAGFRAAVYVTGHTIEGRQLCLITTALFATELGADVTRTEPLRLVWSRSTLLL